MGLIRGLKTVDIIYTTFVEGAQVHIDKFKTLQELRTYFSEHKRCGEAVGYVIIKNRTPGFNDNLLTGKLSVEWTGDFGYTCKDFDNVFQMVDFLVEQPLLAEAVGYQKKT